ncbi:MAG TPA: adenylate/guanylate cyclase domain-containing protein, partial [Bradyrhizobium sp.]|nr:adenylate/guanylate cyclase domain-containing protein [Bradyrhizobium sp.]
MNEARKLAAILVSDVVGYSRLAGADEDRILARLRTLRSDVIDPIISVHHGRIVKRTGDGAIVEFRSVVDAVRCAIEVQTAMVERNAEVPAEKRIEFRLGVHLGDVVEEGDGDLMGDGVNIAARLQSVAKPGTICLSEDAYRQVKSRLDLKVSDLGATPLKNIAEPVRVYSLEVGQPAQARSVPSAMPADSVKSSASKGRLGFRPLAAGFAALFLLVAASGWFLLMGRSVKPAQAAHLSVVVLPFANLSGDPAQDYFADGVTENVTTDLSRIRGSFVIARNTAFTYKGKSIDAKEVGKELGVRYVLEGSVQRDQNRVRVNAQLIDAESGAHMWADRFEADTADLFKLQDQVVAQLANALRYELGMAEATKAAGTQNPDAIDLAMRGWAVMPHSMPSKDEADAARPFFEQALKIDPNNSEALAGKAQTNLFEYIYAPRADADYDAAILGPADRAIVLDRDNIHAYRVKGQYLAVSGRPEDAVRALDAGLAVDPNAAGLLAMRSSPKDYLRRFEEAKSDIQQAMLLSPRDPAMSQWFNLRADTELGLGRFDEALEDVKKAVDGGYRNIYS